MIPIATVNGVYKPTWNWGANIFHYKVRSKPWGLNMYMLRTNPCCCKGMYMVDIIGALNHLEIQWYPCNDSWDLSVSKQLQNTTKFERLMGLSIPKIWVLICWVDLPGVPHRFPIPWCCAQVDASPRLAEAPRACATLLAGHRKSNGWEPITTENQLR